ncbi:MAG: glycosyltransferase family 39 protein [Vicinamibacterales bacterium]|jgi:4-amino-4-deoxy-L-arabinose transferase-like glycosyltransferase|nr:glycosyltransferase family 39 protein [Vicinamibacterales bacterium]
MSSVTARVPRAVWLAVAVGIAARLAFSLGYWVDKPLTHDEHEYLRLARNVAEGRGFVHLQPDGTPAPGEHFGRAPVYPVFLAAVIRVTGGPPEAGVPLLRAIRIVQAVLGGALVWLVAWLAGQAAGPGAARAGGWLAAVYPPLVWTPAFVWSETLFSVLALACAAVLALERRRGGLYVAAGALAGLAVLTRPAMLLFLPLAAIWLAWRREWRGVALLSLACALVIMPWTIRNAREYGRVVLVASEGGITFWTGNHPLAVGEGDLAANPQLKRANVALRARHPGLSPEQLEPIYYREARQFIREQPAAWARLMARKAFYAIVPVGPSYRLHSALYFGASVVSYLGVLPFALLGVWRLARAGRLPVPLLLLVASSFLVCLVFFPQERFRIPVVDPALLVTAAAWWALRA